MCVRRELPTAETDLSEEDKIEKSRQSIHHQLCNKRVLLT